MEIPAKTANILRPHRSPYEITCKELLQKFHTNSITRSTLLVKIFGILCVSGPPLNSVGCKVHRKTREKGEVSQNLLARIAGRASDWF